MQKSTLFFLALLFTVSLTAQDSEIQLSDGTSIQGFIDYKGWIKTPDVLRVTKNGVTTNYDPNEIRSFEVNGDRYISKEVELNITEQNLQNLSDFTNLESIQKHVFLKVIVYGSMGLYSYRDSRVHYFAEKDGKFIELLRLRRRSKATINRYVGQLNILFADCDQNLKTNNIAFTSTGLKRAVIAYNKCVAGNSGYVEQKESLKLSFYAVGGYKLSSYELDNPNFVFDDDSSGSFTFGAGASIGLLRNVRNLELRNEVLFQHYEFEASYRDQRLPEQYTDFFLSVDVSFVEIHSLLRYNFGNETKKIRPFINVGVNNAIQVSDNSEEYRVSYFFGDENRVDSEPLEGELKKSRIGMLLGAGLDFDFMNVEVRYGFNPKLSDFPAISRTSDLNLLMAFKVF